MYIPKMAPKIGTNELPDDLLRLLVTSVIKTSKLSREQIAQRLSLHVGQPISKRMLDDWTAGSKKPARFPACFVNAFCEVTQILKTADAPKADAASGQLGLLPHTDLDDQIAALKLSQSEWDVVLRRYRIVDVCLNCNWKAQGYNSKEEFLRALAERNKTSVRSIQR